MSEERKDAVVLAPVARAFNRAPQNGEKAADHLDLIMRHLLGALQAVEKLRDALRRT